MPISSGPSSLPAITALAIALLVAPGLLRADTKERVPKPRAKPKVLAPADPAPTKSVSQASNVSIIPRGGWKAKPPLFAMKAHKPVSIMLHHTAGPVNKKRDIFFKMRSLQAYSQKPAKLGNNRKRKAWADVPYHFYVASDGSIAEGRDVNFSGDTNTNYSPDGHIQVVLEGNFENTKPTARQMAAIEPLLVNLARKWSVPASEIRVHQHVASTLCPGKHFLDAFPALKDRVSSQLQSQ